MKTNFVTVKLDDREVKVEKLPLGKYSDLLKAIKELPKYSDKIKGLDAQKIVELLPQIIGDAMPDLMGILAIATPLTIEEIAQLGLDDAVKLVVAVVEVNKYQHVYESLKALAQPAPRMS